MKPEGQPKHSWLAFQPNPSISFAELDFAREHRIEANPSQNKPEAKTGNVANQGKIRAVPPTLHDADSMSVFSR